MVDTSEATADGTLHADIPTLSVDPPDVPGCVTDTVTVTAGVPDVVVKVRVAVRDVAPGFAAAVNATD